MTTHPSSLSTFAMSAGEESEPTVRTAIGITLCTIRHDIEDDPMTAGRLKTGFHDRAVEVRRQMLPFRFGVLRRGRANHVGLAGPGPYGRGSRLLDPVRF